MSRKTKLELTSGDESRHRRRIVDRLNWAVSLWNQLLDKLTIGGPTEPINFCDTLYVDCVNKWVGIRTEDMNHASLSSALGFVTLLHPVRFLLALVSSASDAAGNYVGQLEYGASANDSGHKRIASISSQTEGGTANKRGGTLEFWTKPDNSSGLVQRVVIDSSGNLIIANDLYFSGAGAGLPYGGISAVDNSTQTTIASAGVAVQVTIFDINNPSNLTTPDHTNDHITIDKAGDYFVSVSATVNSVAGASSRFEMTARKNNGATLLAPLHCDRNIAGGGGNSDVVSMSGIVTLAANDTVEVWIENETNTQNYIVENISLDVFMVGG